MLELNYLITGFLNKDQQSDFVNKLEAIGYPLKKCQILTSIEAKKQIEPDENGVNITNRLIRWMQKNIGGGPTEFIRDVKQMESNELLFVAQLDDIDKSLRLKVKDLVKKMNLKQAKYFGGYSVEHITFKKGHDAEMPLNEELTE